MAITTIRESVNADFRLVQVDTYADAGALDEGILRPGVDGLVITRHLMPAKSVQARWITMTAGDVLTFYFEDCAVIEAALKLSTELILCSSPQSKTQAYCPFTAVPTTKLSKLMAMLKKDGYKLIIS